MIKEIAELFDIHQGDILNTVADRYGLDKTKLVKLGGFESFVYECEHLILKITHSIRRTKPYVMGELEFVSFLAENGVSAAIPVPSQRGNLVETIPLEVGYFLIYAFQKAKGNEPTENQLNADFYEKWGQLTGQIHALTKTFQPSHSSYKRQEWHEEEVLDFAKYVPLSQVIVHEKKERVFEMLHRLPKERDSYGLTHNDIHYGNIYIEDGKLTLFDFDDCTYQWFVNDIAIAVHSVLPGYDQEAQFGVITEYFMTHFIKGYTQENRIGSEWLAHVSDFLRFYDLIDYGIFYQAWDMDNLSDARKITLARVRHRIENDICIVETDFEKFSQ
jgi:Ser/Thr protein kinase RdoA (MazF antagonist)